MEHERVTQPSAPFDQIHNTLNFAGAEFRKNSLILIRMLVENLQLIRQINTYYYIKT